MERSNKEVSDIRVRRVRNATFDPGSENRGAPTGLNDTMQARDGTARESIMSLSKDPDGERTERRRERPVSRFADQTDGDYRLTVLVPLAVITVEAARVHDFQRSIPQFHREEKLVECRATHLLSAVLTRGCTHLEQRN